MSDFDWTPHLQPDEKLLWSGRPIIDPAKTRSYGAMAYALIWILATTLFLSFALLVTIEAGSIRYRFSEGYHAALERLENPLQLVGFICFWLVFAGALTAYTIRYDLDRPNFRYAITSRRALLFQPHKMQQIASVELTRQIMILRNADRLEFRQYRFVRLFLRMAFDSLGATCKTAEEIATTAKDNRQK